MTHPLTATLVAWAGRNFRTWGAALRWLQAHEARSAQDMPTFASVDAVLWFAFGHEVPTTKTAAMFAMAGRARDELWGTEEEKERAKSAPVRTRDPEIDRRPTGADAVTQAAMVLGFVRRLPKQDHLYVVAKYAQGKERVAARRALRDILLLTIAPNMKVGYCVYMLISRYYGKVVVLDDLADDLEHFFPAKDAAKKARSFVRRLAGEVESRLRDMAASAESKCFDYFKVGNLIK